MLRHACLMGVVAVIGCGTEMHYMSADDVNVGGGTFATNSPPTVRESDNHDGADKGDVDATDLSKVSDRQIIYTGTVDLVVDSVRDLDTKIKDKLKEYKGYISQYRENRVYGDRLQGNWTLRVPAEHFQEFLDILVDAGVANDQQINAQDVTEEYVDLDRRLENKKRLEERILKLLDEHAGAIKDVIEVETQLARVREDIERMEGRLRYLRNHVTMTTITVTALEDKDYTPPQAPSFSTQIADTFGGSIDSLIIFGKAAVLFVVGASPWLVLIVVFGSIVFVGVRRRRRINRNGGNRN